MSGINKEDMLDILGPIIGWSIVDVDINSPKIEGGWYIKGSSLDIHRPKFDAGLDIHESKLGLPKVDADINAPKIGSGLPYI